MIVSLEREVAATSILYQFHSPDFSSDKSLIKIGIDRYTLLAPPTFPGYYNFANPGFPPIEREILDEIAIGSIKEGKIKVQALQFLRFAETYKPSGTNHMGVRHYEGWTGLEIVRAVEMSRPLIIQDPNTITPDPDEGWEVFVNKAFGLSHDDKTLRNWSEYIAVRTTRIAKAVCRMREQRDSRFNLIRELDRRGMIGYRPRIIVDHHHHLLTLVTPAA